VKAAVLGSPIAHSLSPALHTAAYASLGLTDWSYARFELVADELPGFVAGLDDDWRGLSLTMPLKEACLQVAADVTPLAQRAGAGNTLVRLPSGEWRAHNTDVSGLVDALRPAWDAAWTRAAVLGAGATARSALLALDELGVTRVNLYARNAIRAEEFRAWAATAAPGIDVSTAPLEHRITGDEPAVVSTLPGGAADGFTVPGPRAGLLFDSVYAGWPTPLGRAASAAGMTVIGGLDLLVHQAARQFELFTGRAAPLAEMFAAGRAALPLTTSAGQVPGPPADGGPAA
jgi:shikimate dehydrogenase